MFTLYRNLVEASVQCMLNILCYKEGYHRFQPQVFSPRMMSVHLWDPEGTTKARQISLSYWDDCSTLGP